MRPLDIAQVVHLEIGVSTCGDVLQKLPKHSAVSHGGRKSAQRLE
jgi:hypothetical protein